MKRQFPKVPILGLTATATSSVIADVQNILNIHGCLVLRASFNRPNLKYEVNIFVVLDFVSFIIHTKCQYI